jgi:hypothetical protein
MSVAAATDRCAVAMDGVARTQVHAHVSSTVGRRHKVANEFQDFLDALPEEFGVTWETVGPEHVLWYAQEWLPKHIGAWFFSPSTAGGSRWHSIAHAWPWCVHGYSACMAIVRAWRSACMHGLWG